MDAKEGYRLARTAASPMSQQMVVDRIQRTVADVSSWFGSLWTGRDRRETRQCLILAQVQGMWPRHHPPTRLRFPAKTRLKLGYPTLGSRPIGT